VLVLPFIAPPGLVPRLRWLVADREGTYSLRRSYQQWHTLHLLYMYLVHNSVSGSRARVALTDSCPPVGKKRFCTHCVPCSWYWLVGVGSWGREIARPREERRRGKSRLSTSVTTVVGTSAYTVLYQPDTGVPVPVLARSCMYCSMCTLARRQRRSVCLDPQARAGH
jgi:hypothetical protein